MIKRTETAEGLRQTMEATPALKHVYVDMDEWIADERNVCYDDGNGNFGAFEFNWPGVYTGHYFFSNARGRAALDLSRAVLRQMFEHHNAMAIRGLTPVDHKAALWMNRQLGFKPHNVVDTEAGPHRVFVLTKADFDRDTHA